MQGIFVAPGVIDIDFEGVIMVMTYSPDGISMIKSGQRLFNNFTPSGENKHTG